MPGDKCRCGCGRFEHLRPASPRVTVFIDGQNLFKQLQRCFGDHEVPYENYDPVALAQALNDRIPGGNMQQVRFYSGLPWAWNGNLGEADVGNLLNRKMAHYKSLWGPLFRPFTRLLAYRPPETTGGRPIGREKGVDVALAIDLVMESLDDHLDAAIIVSQDKDLNPAADAVDRIRQRMARWIHLESVFPITDSGFMPENQKGINRTRWAGFDRTLYRTCLEGKDLRDRYKTGDVVTFPADYEYVGHIRTSTCKHARKDRRAFAKGTFFPECYVCRAPIFWCRYTRFIPDDS